jgi:hypothetical protein
MNNNIHTKPQRYHVWLLDDPEINGYVKAHSAHRARHEFAAQRLTPFENTQAELALVQEE